MPRKRGDFEEKPRKQKRLRYPKENVALALKELREGKKICQLVRKYGIPASTIRAKSSGLHADKPGPAAVFSPEEERGIADWIFRYSGRGFRVTKTHLLECVRMLCIKAQRKNPFPNNVPGRSWYENYLKRFPDVGRKIAENFAASRLSLSKDRLRKWFQDVPGYLAAGGGVVAVGPERIFNCADIELPLHPSSVLFPTGNKKSNNDDRREHISVLITCNAEGRLAPTFIVFAGKALPSNVTAAAPKDYAFGFSENGSVLAPNFYEYMTKVFEPWLTKNNVERPVVVYIDGHSPFLNFYLTDFCSVNRIILVPLYNNALHIIQPLDVALFIAFKSKWMESCQEFSKNSPTIGIHKYQVAPLVRRILGSMCLDEILKEGFRNCGLYPFNEKAVDYLKTKKKTQNPPPSLTYDLQVSNGDNETVQNSSLADFEKFLTQDQILLFRANGGPVWRGETKDEGLYNIWYKLWQPTNISNGNQFIRETANDSQLPDCSSNIHQSIDEVSNIGQTFNDISNIYLSNDDITNIRQITSDISNTNEYATILTNDKEMMTSTSNKEIDGSEDFTELDLDDIIRYAFQESNTFLVVQNS